MIHVRRIQTDHVLGHDAVTLDLPDTGVVVITGDNGAGKSTCIEAVAAALWGKTLRGSPWHVEGVRSYVLLDTEMAVVERVRDHKTNVVRFAPPGGSRREFETATKAQAELDSLVGDLETWRRTSVFSSQDVLSFSLATDAERKRLVEGMLGLHVFDIGLDACRKDIAEARQGAANAASAVRTMQARLEGERKRLVDAGGGPGAEPPHTAPSEVRKLEAALAEARRDGTVASRASATAAAEATALRQKAADARRVVERAQAMTHCPTCAQPVDDAVRARLGAGAAETVRAAEAGAPAAEESARASADEAAELADEQQALAERVGTARAAVVARREWEERDRYHREKAAEVQRAVREAEGELLDLEDAASAADARLAELQAVERVLGLRGVRSHVIAGALGGLEAVANAWLDRLMPGGAISLRSDSETARGGTVERIALDIHGLGHDHGYKGCSGGERRRVDVAMVLALAEVHAAAAGTGQGTMWFDEVFDTLDPAGIAGVSEALSEIAEDRCVVVITHSDDVASELDAAQRFVFANGVAS